MLDWDAPTGGYLLTAMLRHRPLGGRKRSALSQQKRGGITRPSKFTSRSLDALNAPFPRHQPILKPAYADVDEKADNADENDADQDDVSELKL